MLLQFIYVWSLRNILNENWCFKNILQWAFLANPFDTFGNCSCNIGDKYFWNFCSFPPENVSDPLLSLRAVYAHIEIEMFKYKQRQEITLSRVDAWVWFSAEFVACYIRQSIFQFLYPCKILLCKLDGFFRIVFELDITFTLVKVFACPEGSSNPFITLLLETSSITFYWGTFWIRLAHYINPSMAAFAVNSYFRVAWSIWTWLSWMTKSLTFVTTLFSQLTTALTASIF